MKASKVGRQRISWHPAEINVSGINLGQFHACIHTTNIYASLVYTKDIAVLGKPVWMVTQALGASTLLDGVPTVGKRRSMVRGFVRQHVSRGVCPSQPRGPSRKGLRACTHTSVFTSKRETRCYPYVNRNRDLGAGRGSCDQTRNPRVPGI